MALVVLSPQESIAAFVHWSLIISIPHVEQELLTAPASGSSCISPPWALWPVPERSLIMSQKILCMDSKETTVLVQIWLFQHNKTDQGQQICIILTKLKSSGKPLIVLLLGAVVAVCMDCSQKKQYCSALTDGQYSGLKIPLKNKAAYR